MVKVNWTPENEKKLLLHLINPTTANIDTAALAKLFPGATPKAIHERIQKLRRERAALVTTDSASENAIEDGNTGEVTGEAEDTPKKKRGRLSKKEIETGVGGPKNGNPGRKRNVEAMEDGAENETKIKHEYGDPKGKSGGDGVLSGGKGESGYEMDEDGSELVGQLLDNALGKLAKAEENGEGNSEEQAETGDNLSLSYENTGYDEELTF